MSDRVSDSTKNDEGSGRHGLIGLLRQIPDQVSRLIRDEIRAAQVEIVGKLKALGVGTGLVAGGAIIALYSLGVLIATAILGLATVLSPWLSALIIGVLLLIVAGLLAYLGLKKLKAGVPPVPTETIENVKADIRTVKGVGK